MPADTLRGAVQRAQGHTPHGARHRTGTDRGAPQLALTTCPRVVSQRVVDADSWTDLGAPLRGDVEDPVGVDEVNAQPGDDGQPRRRPSRVLAVERNVVDLLREIDQEARHLGVTRQAFIKVRLADSLTRGH